eukprot:2094822-Pleurochrysis_carterae.AAC.2
MSSLYDPPALHYSSGLGYIPPHMAFISISTTIIHFARLILRPITERAGWTIRSACARLLVLADESNPSMAYFAIDACLGPIAAISPPPTAQFILASGVTPAENNCRYVLSSRRVRADRPIPSMAYLAVDAATMDFMLRSTPGYVSSYFIFDLYPALISDKRRQSPMLHMAGRNVHDHVGQIKGPWVRKQVVGGLSWHASGALRCVGSLYATNTAVQVLLSDKRSVRISSQSRWAIVDESGSPACVNSSGHKLTPQFSSNVATQT